ncbi:MAG: AMP-binding protein [Gammaproteobacteria bacterium]|jgi:long-chain acyl-CoA synthetase|nr:AMP-binding protein [Gammaproteobacteria bacterium]MBT7369936.1 AMP-binding protein [Gammaproteobacteria bacterium]
MYAGDYAHKNPERPAFIMASSGESVSYREYEERANRLAHLLRDEGLKRLDHYSVFMENNNRYVECCSAGERTGLYYTCVNSYLKDEELAYILNNSESKLLITSSEKLAVAKEALKLAPNITRCLVVGGKTEDDRIVSFEDAVSGYPGTPVADEYLGTSMLYSSGTTGRPKGILRSLEEASPENPLPLHSFLQDMWCYREDMIYLSPAPLYHSAPQAAVALTIRKGGTAVIMEHFDAEDYLNFVSQYQVTHSQLVPTMFSRMLKLPESIRAKADTSSLEVVIHAAAPCPVQVKEAMIDWWGPIIHEYYGATEGLGFSALNSEEWLQHRGSVGKVILGELHVLDEAGDNVADGTSGELWFKRASEFTYFNNEEKTKESTSADGSMSTVGDVGYLKDGYLYLTDRSTFMIISGGVNIYPQETENLLITHPKIADAAVFGVPNEDLGEEVKAVIQVMPGIDAGEELVEEMMAFCMEHLSRQKCPRSIDFEDELPRLPTGKLYKRLLKDRYWAEHKNSIL